MGSRFQGRQVRFRLAPDLADDLVDRADEVLSNLNDNLTAAESSVSLAVGRGLSREVARAWPPPRETEERIILPPVPITSRPLSRRPEPKAEEITPPPPPFDPAPEPARPRVPIMITWTSGTARATRGARQGNVAKFRK